MGRLGSLLHGSVLAYAGTAVLLALAVLALSSSGRAGERGGKQAGAPVKNPGAGGGEVVDLSALPGQPVTPKARPSENVSESDLASIEQEIKARTADDAAAPDDGVSPGAPSDKEVREALRQLKEEQSGIPAGEIRRGSGDMIYPINGQFTSPFGQRWGRLHAGIDLAAPTGTPIRAAASGQVILMAPTGGYGNYTCINHGKSISTCYAHQSRFGTSRGASVKQGEVMGYVGNTGHSFGAHLHFEVRINGKPVDPMEYL
jgi:murein DD-endopeptidase MepM/ murein hydrolase activator NlpD